MYNRKLAVIGIGTAGIQALCHFLSWLNEDWEITSIYDNNIPIVGIGESTNPTFTNAIEWGLDFDLIRDSELLDGTLKYGTHYKNWRGNEFKNPLLNGTAAIHLNTFKLKEFAFERFPKLWGQKFKEITGTVTDMVDSDDYVTMKINGVEHQFEYVIDCTGFPKSYEGYTVITDAPVNHALVHNKKTVIATKYEPTWTGHTATKDGWMFTIPLLSRTSYGYLFNDNDTTVEQARENFAKEIDVPLDELQKIEYTFNFYWKKEFIGKRIIKNGNSAAFMEPLFANSGFLYDRINRLAFDYILGNTNKEKANADFVRTAEGIANMISYHYHGGSVYDTPFWQRVIKSESEKLFKCKEFLEIRPVMQRYTRNKLWALEPTWGWSPRHLVTLDTNFGYNYFK